MSWEIRQGDCVEEMAAMADESIDAVVCDPPYGLGFMGHEWDQPGDHGPVAAAADEVELQGGKRRRTQPQNTVSFGGDPHPAMEAGRYDLSKTANRRYQGWCEVWARQAFRVLKPGGYLLASCGTRTYHRLASGVEDAGFEIRDSLLWLYGSGFPKSLDVHARLCMEADRVRRQWLAAPYGSQRAEARHAALLGLAEELDDPVSKSEWEGWGTALKPAYEPIVVARKPLIGTVVANVLEYGTGALNVDGCRIEGEPDVPGTTPPTANSDRQTHSRMVRSEYSVPEGRWPANVVLSHTPLCEQIGFAEVESNGHHPGKRGPSGYGANDRSNAGGLHGHEGLVERHMRGEVVEVWECAPGCPVAVLDAQSGPAGANASVTGEEPSSKTPGGIFGKFAGRKGLKARGDSGGASRFFYSAKTSRSERDAGLEAFEKKPLHWSSGDQSPGTFQSEGTEKEARNPHPTVKPINLMRWLVRLVTPPGGTVLDPFAGSGTTGCAAALEGLDFIGCERDDEYVPIARARLIFWAEHEGREVEDVLGVLGSSRRDRQVHADAGQMELG